LTERPTNDAKRRAVMTTIVSSPMLGVIARSLGVHYEERLTGFKWIANRAIELGREGYEFVFGYEEALGYTIGDVVRDKDGIGAAAMVAEMTAVLAARGQTLLSELEAIHRRHGLFVSSQVSVTKKGAAGAAAIRTLMDRLRSAPLQRIGDHDVNARCDYSAKERCDRDGTKSALSLPKSNVLSFELAGGSRIVARPSGTEPKVKFYFDVREVVKEGEGMDSAELRAHAIMKAMADAFVALATSG
jgi:phosphomannomutase